MLLGLALMRTGWARERVIEVLTDFPFGRLLYQEQGVGELRAMNRLGPSRFSAVVDKDEVTFLRVTASEPVRLFRRQTLDQKVNFGGQGTLISQLTYDYRQIGIALLLASGLAVLLGLKFKRKVDRTVDVLANQFQEETEILKGQMNYYRADGKPPDRIEQFKVTKELGKGGMATVFEVIHPDGSLGALKLPVQQLAADEEFRKRFWREMDLGARLRHPNVVRIDFVSPPTNPEVPPFYVMEYLKGQTLDHVEKPVPLAQACAYARQLLSALEYIHDQGVIHRDLKPANIMRRDDGRLVIMDFGLALLTDKDRSRLTASGHVLGTPLFMAPEQVTGAEPGPHTDLYALGLIIYEMVEGSLNLPEEAMAVLTHKIHHGISPLRTSVPAAFQSWMFQMTDANPQSRYGSAGEALAALNVAVPP